MDSDIKAVSLAINGYAMLDEAYDGIEKSLSAIADLWSCVDVDDHHNERMFLAKLKKVARWGILSDCPDPVCPDFGGFRHARVNRVTEELKAEGIPEAVKDYLDVANAVQKVLDEIITWLEGELEFVQEQGAE